MGPAPSSRASGLGRSLAARFIEAGHTVIGCGRSPERVEELQRTYGPPHHFRAVDVADAGAVGRWWEETRVGGYQPDLLINLSNDGWYPGSSELEMHLAIGVFRTIEHRVPLARAVNTGFTALIDGNGEIRARLPKNVEDQLVVQVPLDDRTTWYSRWGDWLGVSCLAVTIGWIPMGLVRPRRPARPPD